MLKSAKIDHKVSNKGSLMGLRKKEHYCAASKSKKLRGCSPRSITFALRGSERQSLRKRPEEPGETQKICKSSLFMNSEFYIFAIVVNVLMSTFTSEAIPEEFNC